MANLTMIGIYLVALLGYFAFFSVIAGIRGTPIWTFWSGPAAALAPWIVVTIIVLVVASLVPKSSQQAAVMSGMFPMLASFGVAAIAPVMSLFQSPDTTWIWRAKWFGGVSGVVALIVGAFIIVVMINSSESTPG